MDFDIYVNNVKLPYVASYQVGWYDVSKDSGRDTTTADGTMILNVISQKFRLDITTKYLTGVELNDFYTQDNQLVSTKVNEGGFVSIVSSLKDPEAKIPGKTAEKLQEEVIDIFTEKEQAKDLDD